MLKLRLGRGEDRRIRNGHPWVFSNEISEIRGDREAGTAAEICDAGGACLGTGYYNPHSLIAARILSREGEDIDQCAFYLKKFEWALAYRRAIYPAATTFRLIHGEGDFLPGLVVDKYGDYLSVQFLTYGMERRRELVLEALRDLFRPRGIVARNDVAVRSLEGLPETVEVLDGHVPGEVEIEEHGLRFHVDLLGGQKTGHFLDQKDNHLLLREIAPGKEVLDCFSFSGSWGVHAGFFGARRVTCIDISPGAIARARENARLNDLEEVMEFETVDAFERLRSLKGEGRRFDVVILDPPAFVKSKKALKEAEKGYLTINRRAMELLQPGGYLITCSCSFHMGREPFREILVKAAQQAGRSMRLITARTQAPDHPILLAVPETEYLKVVVLRAEA
ncbi:MAG TPA: class I SAM-dependent rRNA methyltransferase [Geobacteraceae bacterium]